MESKKQILNIMLDIETLGTKPGCIILSYCLKGFLLPGQPNSYAASEKEQCCATINVASSLLRGFIADGGTIDWWNDPKRDEARMNIVCSQKESENVTYALSMLYDYMSFLAQNYDTYIWGRGVDSFDLPILDEAMRRIIGPSYKTPWKFYQVMDLRSIFRFCQWSGFTTEQQPTPHTANADVQKQITEAQSCWRYIKNLQGKAQSIETHPDETSPEDHDQTAATETSVSAKRSWKKESDFEIHDGPFSETKDTKEEYLP